MSATTPILLLLILMLLGGCNKMQMLSQPSASPATSARIVFFGDSITAAGVQPDGYISIIKNFLKQEYPERSFKVIGAGVSGNRVPNLLARLEKDVLVKAPTHVVIYIGINDVWHFYEFNEETGTDPEAFEQGLRELIAKIQETGAEVLLCTPSVIGEDPDSDAPVNQLLREYAEISRVVASTSAAHLCDLRAAFEQYLQTHNPEQVNAGILTSDGVHLNDQGNRFVAQVMFECLRPLLAASVSQE